MSYKTKKLTWQLKTCAVYEISIICAELSNGAWESDETGRERVEGLAIHMPDNPKLLFDLYRDDGKGNGRLLSSHTTMGQALWAAEAEDYKLCR